MALLCALPHNGTHKLWFDHKRIGASAAAGLQWGRPQDGLDHGSNVFRKLLRQEVLQLARDITEQYDISINVDELVVILGFVRMRHKISHASLTEANSVQGVLDIIASAGGPCTERWPLGLLPHQKSMTKVASEYESDS